MADDARALEAVLAGVGRRRVRAAVRMVWHPDDAADATQDILIKVMTRPGSYRGDAAVRTWVFRIAANHLLDARRSRVERQALSFAADLVDRLADPPEQSDVDLSVTALPAQTTRGPPRPRTGPQYRPPPARPEQHRTGRAALTEAAHPPVLRHPRHR